MCEVCTSWERESCANSCANARQGWKVGAIGTVKSARKLLGLIGYHPLGR
jgi:hypothetical protein